MQAQPPPPSPEPQPQPRPRAQRRPAPSRAAREPVALHYADGSREPVETDLVERVAEDRAGLSHEQPAVVGVPEQRATNLHAGAAAAAVAGAAATATATGAATTGAVAGCARAGCAPLRRRISRA